MNGHVHLERLVLKELLLQAAIESEFARLVGGRKIGPGSPAEERAGAELERVVPSQRVTFRSRANQGW
jgi:hypothetical protein